MVLGAEKGWPGARVSLRRLGGRQGLETEELELIEKSKKTLLSGSVRRKPIIIIVHAEESGNR